MPGYTVTVDREACDGVFACLVRDTRFVEDADGLAAVDPADAAAVETTADAVVAAFDDDARADAERAAAACPLDAIDVADAVDAEKHGDRRTSVDAEGST